MDAKIFPRHFANIGGSLVVQTILLLSIFAGCAEKNETPKVERPIAPQLDFSTPDRALKSYWAQKDWLTEVSRMEYAAVTKEATLRERDAMAKVTSGEVKEYFLDGRSQDLFQTYRREIVSIKQETESRAVALVKITNATPIPRDIEPSVRDLKERAEGEQFRYVLEREGKEWKVAEVSRLDYSKSWQPLYRMEKPSVPTYVFTD